ncbi:hypothetical protein ABK040_004727 [Willaertia magna]
MINDSHETVDEDDWLSFNLTEETLANNNDNNQQKTTNSLELLIKYSNGDMFIYHIFPYLSKKDIISNIYLINKKFSKFLQKQINKMNISVIVKKHNLIPLMNSFMTDNRPTILNLQKKEEITEQIKTVYSLIKVDNLLSKNGECILNNDDGITSIIPFVNGLQFHLNIFHFINLKYFKEYNLLNEDNVIDFILQFYTFVIERNCFQNINRDIIISLFVTDLQNINIGHIDDCLQKLLLNFEILFKKFNNLNLNISLKQSLEKKISPKCLSIEKFVNSLNSLQSVTKITKLQLHNFIFDKKFPVLSNLQNLKVLKINYILMNCNIIIFEFLQTVPQNTKIVIEFKEFTQNYGYNYNYTNFNYKIIKKIINLQKTHQVKIQGNLNIKSYSMLSCINYYSNYVLDNTKIIKLQKRSFDWLNFLQLLSTCKKLKSLQIINCQFIFFKEHLQMEEYFNFLFLENLEINSVKFYCLENNSIIFDKLITEEVLNKFKFKNVTSITLNSLSLKNIPTFLNCNLKYLQYLNLAHNVLTNESLLQLNIHNNNIEINLNNNCIKNKSKLLKKHLGIKFTK